MTKKEIQKYMQNAGLLPLFYHSDCEVTMKVIQACYEGGCRVFEYTNRGENARKNFPILKDYIQKNCPDMIIGIGTILNVQQAVEFINLGADFIVSPYLDDETGAWCMKNDIYWIPGCGTVTECAKAIKLGADIIKIFPGNVLGSGFVKATLGPLPALKLMPAGGVEPTEQSISEWFNAGVVCVGIGSLLFPKEIIEKRKYDEITLIVKQVFEYIHKHKTI